MNEFSLNIYSNKAEELRQETKETFEQLNLVTDVLPATMQPDDGAIKLVFVGQYSAGKSSIIKINSSFGKICFCFSCHVFILCSI